MFLDNQTNSWMWPQFMEVGSEPGDLVCKKRMLQSVEPTLSTMNMTHHQRVLKRFYCPKLLRTWLGQSLLSTIENEHFEHLVEIWTISREGWGFWEVSSDMCVLLIMCQTLPLHLQPSTRGNCLSKTNTAYLRQILPIKHKYCLSIVFLVLNSVPLRKKSWGAIIYKITSGSIICKSIHRESKFAE